VAVEKLPFHPKLPKFGDRKCPGDRRESFIGHPDAILFSRLSREGVFQQPQAISPTMLWDIAGRLRVELWVRNPKTVKRGTDYFHFHCFTLLVCRRVRWLD